LNISKIPLDSDFSPNIPSNLVNSSSNVREESVAPLIACAISCH